jgi:hypothetical protein
MVLEFLVWFFKVAPISTRVNISLQVARNLKWELPRRGRKCVSEFDWLKMGDTIMSADLVKLVELKGQRRVCLLLTLTAISS